MDKDNIIASIPFSEMITPMTFTSDSKLYNDYTFLTLNMISQISGGMNNDFYNKIHPEFASTPQEIIVFEKIMWQKVTLILMKNVLLVPTYD